MKRIHKIVLLVVLALAGSCFGVTWYTYHTFSEVQQEVNASLKDISNLKKLGIALRMYATDHAGDFPPDLDTLVTQRYARDGGILYSVATGERYAYISGLRNDDDPMTIIAYDEKPFMEGKHIALYVDRRVVGIDKASLDKQLDAQAED